MAEEALLHSQVETLVFSEEAIREGKDEVFSIAEKGRTLGARLIVAGGPAFDKLTSEKAPQGVIAVSHFMDCHVTSREMDFASWNKGKRLLILDCIRDPGNFGTMIRTAAAMGFNGIMTVDCADLYSTKTLRASMGAAFRCDIYDSSNPSSDIKVLQSEGRRVLAAALGEVSYLLEEAELFVDDCIVIGNEGHGISKEILAACDAALKIPMTEGSESLNAAAAAAIIMWEYKRRFR